MRFSSISQLDSPPPASGQRCAGRWLAGVDSTNVTVSVTPTMDVKAWGVEEAIPAGMQVVSVGADGTWDANHRKIKWEFRDASPRIISYSLSGDPGTIGNVTGYVSFDGSEDPVSGSAAVAAPLPFMTWAERHGIPGTQTEAFSALHARSGPVRDAFQQAAPGAVATHAIRFLPTQGGIQIAPLTRVQWGRGCRPWASCAPPPSGLPAGRSLSPLRLCASALNFSRNSRTPAFPTPLRVPTAPVREGAASRGAGRSLYDQPRRADLPEGLPLLAGDKLPVIGEDDVLFAPVPHGQGRRAWASAAVAVPKVSRLRSPLWWDST